VICQLSVIVETANEQTCLIYHSSFITYHLSLKIMNLVFMGTPEFAAMSLDALIRCGKHKVLGVFCQPDKPKGRGQQRSPPPTKLLASEHSIPVFQPATWADGEAERVIRELAPDIAVAVAYGKILPQGAIDAPRLGTLNVHASLLPRWRGAAPIQRAIMEGDTETGVSIQQVRFELDSGEVLSYALTTIRDEETFGSLYARLAELSAKLLITTLHELPALIPRPQSGAITFAPPIVKADTVLDLSRSAFELTCQVRGLSPKPGATVSLFDERGEPLTVKVYRVHAGGGSPLTLSCGKNGSELLSVDELQAPGGKRLEVADFLRGKKVFAKPPSNG
jgi:methionyl-tRNA formyltransferase